MNLAPSPYRSDISSIVVVSHQLLTSSNKLEKPASITCNTLITKGQVVFNKANAEGNGHVLVAFVATHTITSFIPFPSRSATDFFLNHTNHICSIIPHILPLPYVHVSN